VTSKTDVTIKTIYESPTASKCPRAVWGSQVWS